jgi:hypothetical protein
MLNNVIEIKMKAKIEVTGRRGRRCKRLLDDLKVKSGYWKLKQKALVRTLWKTPFGRGYGPVISKTTKWMNEGMSSARKFEPHNRNLIYLAAI